MYFVERAKDDEDRSDEERSKDEILQFKTELD
jgi:hypothetical protein